jgi:hypothetical protein
MALLNFISDLLSGSMIRFYFFGYGLHDPELQYGIPQHSCSLLYTDKSELVLNIMSKLTWNQLSVIDLTYGAIWIA